MNRRDEGYKHELAKLARAKLIVMLSMLGGKPIDCEAKAHKELFREEAYRWFFDRSDFERWCEYAGLEPDYVRGKARRVYEDGYVRPLATGKAAYQRELKARHAAGTFTPRRRKRLPG